MAMAHLQKIASIDAQMRLLVPKRTSDDDKLIEYDALLLDRFLDILEDLHGKELKETVQYPCRARKRLFFFFGDVAACMDVVCKGNGVGVDLGKGAIAWRG